MIDLETLGTRPNALMLTIGAIRFDPFADNANTPLDKMDTFYRRVSLESFDTLDHTVDDATLEWWGKQADDVREEAFAEEDRQPIDKVLLDFYRWVGTVDNIWANGSGFDCSIIEHFCREVKQGIPWDYWKVRDARTIYALAPNVERPTGAAHHAVWDCWAQIVRLQRTFKQLGITQLASKG